MTRSKSILVLGLLLATLAIMTDGCKSKEEKKRNRTLQGSIEEIDLSNKIVTMNWFNEKVGQSIPVAGKITPETEIYIDGKLSDLSQVKVGDKVIVEGYKKGNDIVAMKVNITHTGQSAKPKQATTQPAK